MRCTLIKWKNDQPGAERIVKLLETSGAMVLGCARVASPADLLMLHSVKNFQKKTDLTSCSWGVLVKVTEHATLWLI